MFLHNLVEIEDEEPIQIDEQPKKFQDSKILDLQNRIQVMKKRVEVAQKELGNVSLKKRNIREKMNEYSSQKTKVEHDLRTKQCEALELNIMSLDDESVQNDVVLAEYSVTCLENEMKMFEDELQSLREQDANLIEDVEEAESSFIGVYQVLLALMFELDTIVHG